MKWTIITQEVNAVRETDNHLRTKVTQGVFALQKIKPVECCGRDQCLCVGECIYFIVVWLSIICFYV